MLCWPISSWHCVYILLSCLHCQHRNIGRHRINVVSTSYLLYPVYIVDIVDIANLTNIESTSYLHRMPSFLLTISSWHCVYSPISFLHRQHLNVDRHRVNSVSTSCAFLSVYIVNIAMLIDIESTSCLQCTSNILFTSSTLSTS